jgi:hypothetical protein
MLKLKFSTAGPGISRQDLEIFKNKKEKVMANYEQ